MKKHYKVIVVLFFILRIVATLVLVSTGCKAGYFGAFSVPFLLAYAYTNGIIALVLLLCYCIILLVSLLLLFFKKTLSVSIYGLQVVLMADILCAAISLFLVADLIKALAITIDIIGVVLCALLLRFAKKEKDIDKLEQ